MDVSEQSNSLKEMNRWIARWENEGGALGSEKDWQREAAVPPPNYTKTRETFISSPLFFLLCTLGVGISSRLSFKLWDRWPGCLNYLHRLS